MKISWPSWLNKNILGFSVASTLSDTSHEIVPLVLPVLIALLVGKQAAPEYVAYISGCAGVLSSLTALFSGTMSDHLTYRKPLLLIGYFLTGSLVGLLAFSSHWITVLILMSGAWLGRGLVSAPRNALIAASSEKKYYGHAFGFRQALDTLGSILGPLIVYFFAALPIHQLFILALIPGVLAFIVVYFFIEDIPQTIQEPFSLSVLTSSLKNRFPRPFYSLLGVFFLFGIANFNKTLIVLRVQEVFSQQMLLESVLATVTLFYIFRNCIQAVASYTVGALSDRVGRLIPLGILGFGFFGLMAFLLSWNVSSPFGSFIWATIIFFLSGVSAGTYTSLQKSLVADMVPEYARGKGYGMLETVISFGSLVSSLVLGLLWSRIGPEAAFLVAAFISFASVGTLTYLKAKVN